MNKKVVRITGIILIACIFLLGFQWIRYTSLQEKENKKIQEINSKIDKTKKELHNAIIFDNDTMHYNNVVLPIICQGDLWGCIAILGQDAIPQHIIDSVRIVCTIISNYLAE